MTPAKNNILFSALLRHIFILIVILTLLRLPPLAHAQDSSPTPPPTPLPSINPASEEDLLRHSGVSKSSPLSKALFSDEHLPKTYDALLSLIQHVDKAVTFATSTTTSTSAGSASTSKQQEQQVLTTCNHRDDGWKNDVVTYFTVRGLVPPDTACISDVYGTSKSDGLEYVDIDKSIYENLTPSRVYDTIKEHSRLVAKNAAGVIENIKNDWDKKNATRSRQFLYGVRSQSCEYDYLGYVFVDNQWHIVERITNERKEIVQKENERKFLTEFININGTSAPIMRFFNADSQQIDSDFTTSLSNYTGSVTASAYGQIFASENLAIERALQRGEHQTQQADDATTPSNIAILVFPLIMNIVPVALIADVNTIGMLLYTLLTDVLTAIPLAIKGIEVLLIGQRNNHALVTRISGANLKLDDPEIVNGSVKAYKAAEVWVAKCEATGGFGGTGIILLCIALTFMIGGICAEFWAKNYVKKSQNPYNQLSLDQNSGGPGAGGSHGGPVISNSSMTGAHSTAVMVATANAGGTRQVAGPSNMNYRQISHNQNPNNEYEYGSLGTGSGGLMDGAEEDLERERERERERDRGNSSGGVIFGGRRSGSNGTNSRGGSGNNTNSESETNNTNPGILTRGLHGINRKIMNNRKSEQRSQEEIDNSSNANIGIGARGTIPPPVTFKKHS